MFFRWKPTLSAIVLAALAAVTFAAKPAAQQHHQAAPQRAALVAYVTPLRLDAMRVSAGARLTYWRGQLARTEARARVERAHIVALEAAAARARVAHPAAPAPAAVAVPAYGGVYSYSGIEALWLAAGGAPWAASTAACIGEHESGGREWAEHTDNPQQTDYGLFQIGFDPGALNPRVAALTAVRMSGDGRSWAAWTTAPDC